MSVPFIRICRALLGGLVARLRSLGGDTVGAVAIMVAVTLPVLVGSMGLGSEAGYWYLMQRRVQSAADTAAHGAAVRKKAGDGGAAVDATAEYLVHVADGTDDSAVVVNVPPASGSFAGSNRAVEVVVTENLPRFFSQIYSGGTVPIAGRAVALYEDDGTGCVLALSETAQGAITISGSSDSTLTLCDMVSNAAGVSFQMQGMGSSVSANCIQTVGVAVVTDNLTVNCASLREHASAVPDPFAHVAEPAIEGPCGAGSVGQNGQTTFVTTNHTHSSGMPSRCYNGLDVRGTVNFAPGLYIVRSGEFRVNANATVNGAGVVFYLAPDVKLHFNGTATMTVSAPSSGPFAGMIVFSSRSTTGLTHFINGNLGSRLDGAIYAANSKLTVSGNASTSANSCTQIVTGTVEFTGSGTIDINCTNPPGPNITLAGRVMLVE